jgi:hypothetical protein
MQTDRDLPCLEFSTAGAIKNGAVAYIERRIKRTGCSTFPEVVMSPEITCQICHNPVNLERDRYADENGHIVHEQ